MPRCESWGSKRQIGTEKEGRDLRRAFIIPQREGKTSILLLHCRAFVDFRFLSRSYCDRTFARDKRAAVSGLVGCSAFPTVTLSRILANHSSRKLLLMPHSRVQDTSGATVKS